MTTFYISNMRFSPTINECLIFVFDGKKEASNIIISVVVDDDDVMWEKIGFQNVEWMGKKVFILHELLSHHHWLEAKSFFSHFPMMIMIKRLFFISSLFIEHRGNSVTEKSLQWSQLFQSLSLTYSQYFPYVYQTNKYFFVCQISFRWTWFIHFNLENFPNMKYI